MEQVAFGRFVGLDEHDSPSLLERMSNHDLPVDGSRYGITTRLIARGSAQISDLAVAVLKKLLVTIKLRPAQLGGVVLSSRITDPTAAAHQVAVQLGLTCRAEGIERACSGFPAATRVAIMRCEAVRKPVAVVAVEIISRNINWEPAHGALSDQKRARGQAAKLFADGAAAAIVGPLSETCPHEILDAWQGEVPDEQQLIQKIDVEDAVDPWGQILPGTTTCISMPGRRGYWLVKRAPLILADAIRRSVENARAARRLAGETVSDVVPHQANGLILTQLQRRLGETYEDAEVWNCVADTGNTVSASIPLAMSAVQDRLSSGSLVAMPSVGAAGPGYRPDVLSTGCVLLRVGKQRIEGGFV
jgi:3-oxoacyl-[acyl-carrier-protein] synthase III